MTELLQGDREGDVSPLTDRLALASAMLTSLTPDLRDLYFRQFEGDVPAEIRREFLASLNGFLDTIDSLRAEIRIMSE